MADSFRALTKNIRVSARKARLVVDLVRGKPVAHALDILTLTNKKAAPIVAKTIKSAIANATQNATVDVDRLVVSEIMVDEGTPLKRFTPRAQGRGAPIRKRSCHCLVKVKEL